jgi:hypothetical protein
MYTRACFKLIKSVHKNPFQGRALSKELCYIFQMQAQRIYDRTGGILGDELNQELGVTNKSTILRLSS